MATNNVLFSRCMKKEIFIGAFECADGALAFNNMTPSYTEEFENMPMKLLDVSFPAPCSQKAEAKQFWSNSNVQRPDCCNRCWLNGSELAKARIKPATRMTWSSSTQFSYIYPTAQNKTEKVQQCKRFSSPSYHTIGEKSIFFLKS